MPESIKRYMRYWGFLLGKFLVASLIAGSLFWGVNGYWFSIVDLLRVHWLQIPDYLVYLVLVGIIFLLYSGMIYLSLLDQRYRCRVCLRRLRMPVETGSWSKMLQFGRPSIEYICIYGHGRLNIAELQITGIENPHWERSPEDYWAELCATGAGEPDRE